MNNISKQLRISILVSLVLCLLIILFPPCFENVFQGVDKTTLEPIYGARPTRTFLFAIKGYQWLSTERMLIEILLAMVIGGIVYFVYPLFGGKKKEETK